MSRQSPQFRREMKTDEPKPKKASKAESAAGSADGEERTGMSPNWRWIIFGFMVLAVLVLVVPGALENAKYTSISYDEFIGAVESERPDEQVAKVTIDNASGQITGEFRVVDGKSRGLFRTNGPVPTPETDLELLRNNGVKTKFEQPNRTSIFDYILPFLIPVLIIAIFYLLLRRQAQGQMNGITSIGRSKAKIYTTERPKTTFADVAGYESAKQEINEVVEFLKNPKKFEDIGARIPKGIMLVGPPGTGKTLLARAVAGDKDMGTI